MITRSKSDALYEEAKQYLPGGVNSPVRAFRSVNGSPIYFEKEKAATLGMLTETNTSTFAVLGVHLF